MSWMILTKLSSKDMYVLTLYWTGRDWEAIKHLGMVYEDKRKADEAAVGLALEEDSTVEVAEIVVA